MAMFDGLADVGNLAQWSRTIVLGRWREEVVRSNDEQLRERGGATDVQYAAADLASLEERVEVVRWQCGDVDEARCTLQCLMRGFARVFLEAGRLDARCRPLPTSSTTHHRPVDRTVCLRPPLISSMVSKASGSSMKLAAAAKEHSNCSTFKSKAIMSRFAERACLDPFTIHSDRHSFTIVSHHSLNRSSLSWHFEKINVSISTVTV